MYEEAVGDNVLVSCKFTIIFEEEELVNNAVDRGIGTIECVVGGIMGAEISDVDITDRECEVFWSAGDGFVEGWSWVCAAGSEEEKEGEEGEK
jgi:hypothetical protein